MRTKDIKSIIGFSGLAIIFLGIIVVSIIFAPEQEDSMYSDEYWQGRERAWRANELENMGMDSKTANEVAAEEFPPLGN